MIVYKAKEYSLSHLFCHEVQLTSVGRTRFEPRSISTPVLIEVPAAMLLQLTPGSLIMIKLS